MMAALLGHLWQSTLFALFGMLLVLGLRKSPARVRYMIWFAASVKFLIPFALLTALGRQIGSSDALEGLVSPALISAMREAGSGVLLSAQQLSFEEISRGAQPGLSESALIGAAAVWILGSIALLFRWGAAWIRAVALWRSATPLALDLPIAARSSRALTEPCVIGVLRPVLLLPHGFSEKITHEQLRAVIAHELCHVRRRDNLSAGVHMAVEVLFWFHPLVWWIGARLLSERERACDEAVLQSGAAPRAYAEAILEICRLHVESRLDCIAGISGRDLKQRMEFIMSGAVVPGLTPPRKLALATAGIAAIAAPILSGIFISSKAFGAEDAAARAQVLRGRLAELRERYTDGHPSVQCVLGELGRVISGKRTTDESVIRPGDVLQIYVFDKEELCATVQVRDNGMISSPLVANVPAAGKTARQLAGDIELVLAAVIRSPAVTVSPIP